MPHSSTNSQAPVFMTQTNQSSNSSASPMFGKNYQHHHMTDQQQERLKLMRDRQDVTSPNSGGFTGTQGSFRTTENHVIMMSQQVPKKVMGSKNNAVFSTQFSGTSSSSVSSLPKVEKRGALINSNSKYNSSRGFGSTTGQSETSGQ